MRCPPSIKILFSVSLLLLPIPVNASPITWYYTVNVKNYSDPLPYNNFGSYIVGKDISGSITFDTNASVIYYNPPTFVEYRSMDSFNTYGIEANVDGNVFRVNNTLLNMGNNLYDAGTDSYYDQAMIRGSLNYPYLYPSELLFEITFRGLTTNAINDVSLPVDPFILSDFQTNFRILGENIPGNNGYYWELRGDVTSLSTTPLPPVPEPSTMLLLGSGLAGLVGYGRRRMKK